MGGTPFPIPNRAVKPHSADGTRKGRVGRRQDNVIYSKRRLERGVFCWHICSFSSIIKDINQRIFL